MRCPLLVMILLVPPAVGSAQAPGPAGADVRVYSGSSGEAVSKTRNHVPVTLLDIRLDAGATFTQELPASYNGFAYVIEGGARIGADNVAVRSGQVAWLDRPSRHALISSRRRATTWRVASRG